MPGMGTDPASVRARVEAMEAMLEGLFVIPGIRRRVGLDSIVGLIPIVGDVVTAAMGAWIVWEERNLGMSKFKLLRMAANLGVDTAIGAIPFVGDAFDIFFRSNSGKHRIIRNNLNHNNPADVVITACRNFAG